MRVVGAHSIFPRNLERTTHKDLLPFDCFRPKEKKDNVLLLDYALAACEKAMEKAKVSPSEIDMIISISVTPDRIAISKDVAAPRLCHPLQRELKAENAFVFDLIDADWVIAIDVAKGYAQSLGYKYILIVRAELCHVSILPDEKSGFNIPDGAGVLLLENEPVLEKVYGVYSDVNDHASATITFLDAETLSKEKSKAVFNWDHSDTLSASIRICTDGIKEDFNGHYNHKVKGTICESWYPGHVDVTKHGCYEQQMVYTNSDVQFEHLGPFALPYFSNFILDNKISGIDEMYEIISFNPFLLRYGMQLLNF